MKPLYRFVVAFAACLVGTSASAQTIYRCGNEYTRVPCANGKVVNAESRVTEAQRAEARQVAREERKLADATARARRAEEAANHPAAAASLGPVQAPAASAAAKKKTKQRKKPVASEADEDLLARVPKAKPA